MKPLGGLFDFVPFCTLQGGGLKREAGLFIKPSGKDIFDSFLVLLSLILHIQHTILPVRFDMNSTEFSFQNLSRSTCDLILLNKANVVRCLESDVSKGEA